MARGGGVGGWVGGGAHFLVWRTRDFPVAGGREPLPGSLCWEGDYKIFLRRNVSRIIEKNDSGAEPERGFQPFGTSFP